MVSKSCMNWLISRRSPLWIVSEKHKLEKLHSLATLVASKSIYCEQPSPLKKVDLCWTSTIAGGGIFDLQQKYFKGNVAAHPQISLEDCLHPTFFVEMIQPQLRFHHSFLILLYIHCNVKAAFPHFRVKYQPFEINHSRIEGLKPTPA